MAAATRFDRQWAHRGGQALLWKRDFAAGDVRDLYLPAPAMRPFDRRGFLRVDGTHAGTSLHLFCTQFAADRNGIRDLRFARRAVREVSGNVLLFVADPIASHAGFGDLGLQTMLGSSDVMVCSRGYGIDDIRAADVPGLSAIVTARAVRV
ncbi:MAG: hypothetical protein JO277_08215 [Candidatus Eremiobacteraeota bacterium]|nr:hypothetical protein [Candidatus Eremiobacteraeota bacterium]MBV8722117.1 hypothetical protein [Candidatus Eremiobacteraeota bacterium]